MNDSYNRSSEHRTLVGVDSSSAVPHDDGITLSAKPHAFAGAVLSPKHARELTPSLCLAIASALAEQSHRKALLPYTLWISEAWRVLGWAEPSAALFWEMATMYHALYLATRAHAADYPGTATHIPPILSCGSNSSLGSGTTNPTERQLVTALEKKKISTTASAKELPAWLVGTFLLLHCEEFAYQRNLSGLDDRRFYGATTGQSDASTEPLRNTSNVDFATLFKHPSLSPRTRLHAGWNNDNSHCTAYLLRHLRKILLLAAIPQNQDAVNACVHLAALPSPPPTLSAERLRHSSTNARPKYSPDELRRQHDEEHGQVGSNVKLTLDDLERLHLLLQLPHGGAFEDSPIQIGEFLWTSLKMASPPPMATIPLGDVEEEIRQHLEMELFMAGRGDGNKHGVSADEEETAHSALAKLSLSGTKGGASGDTSDRATQTDNVYQKELSYVHLRGKTIVLKPNPPEPVSGASVTSHEPHATSNFASPSRLHDLVISECSDAHFYLLQPFEHATIAACTGCTIVVGAVAGLLHIVDCEKTSITSAARRLLVSNSSDVQMCVFTPSPPLLVGDNRSCQFAPYNTYYDGFREDLLATGLAAAVVPEHQSPYHGSGGRNYTDTDGSWPPLQCASNKWKHPVELARLEMPQIPPTPPGPSNTSIGGVASAGADDKAMGKSGTGNDTSVHAPVLVPASEFHILFVPIESDASKQRRLEADENDRSSEPGRLESQYCRLLSELLQTSPFRLPMEYERRVLVKVDRMKTIQQSVQKNLTTEQQAKFEEELNRGFRDWLVTSGNLRQVLDLVHLERRGGV